FLGLYDLATKRLSKLAKLPKETARPSVDRAFTVSPDGRSVVYVQNDRPQHDIMIVENFR
ncbi:MAG TPA: hypothetical protein VMG35_02590, partial [Bryobacteraceae bacterium]|nr:hypothetical protein [Bryobacteraceae bacterium]